IIRAFQNSMRDLSVDFPIKLVIYKLFDRVVIGRLSEVFVGANQLLAVHGIEPRVDGPSPARRASQLLGRPASPGVPGVPAWAGGLDQSTLGAFAAPMFGAPSQGGDAMTMPAASAMPSGMPMQWGAPTPALSGAYGDAVLSHEIAQIL